MKLIQSFFLIFLFSIFQLYGQSNPDYDSIAEKVVTYSLQVQPGETVIITGNPSEIDLMGALQVAVRKAGGFTTIELNLPEANKRSIMETDIAYLKITPTYPIIRAKAADCFINTGSIQDPKLFADVPEEKLSALRKAFLPINYTFNNARFRSVGLGQTGGIPTKAYAESQNANYDKMLEMFWKSVNSDYNEMLKTAQRISSKLDSKSKAILTSKEGTNISFEIDNISARINCGRSSENNSPTGPAQAWLPAGEVYTCVNPSSASGKIVVPSRSFRGEEMKNLKITFKNGKITNLTADNNIDAFKEMIENGTGGKDIFSIIDVGINPNSKPMGKSQYLSWEMAGMVTAYVGVNTWAGGSLESDLGLPFHIANATLVVDNETIIKNGKLMQE